MYLYLHSQPQPPPHPSLSLTHLNTETVNEEHCVHSDLTTGEMSLCPSHPASFPLADGLRKV